MGAQLNAIFELPPDLPEDNEENYEKRKEALKKHYEAVARVNHAFMLLEYTNWWLGWRGSMISIPRVVYGDEIKTAAVSMNPYNGNIDLWFNGDFIHRLSAGDLAFVYAHEALHAVYDHLARTKAYPKLWNIVTDAFINEYLHRYVNWSASVKHADRMDYVLKEGVRWSSLPKEIQEEFPVENMNEYSSDQIYAAMVELMKTKGVNPKIFMMGKKKKSSDPNSAAGGRPFRQNVAVKVGDIVFVKSKGMYGRLAEVKRDVTGKVDDVVVEPMPDFDPKKHLRF